MNTLNKDTIFNLKGSDKLSDRRVTGANTTHFLNLAETKYDWATTVYDRMLQNFWIPERINATKDRLAYTTLNKSEQGIYNDLLASLTWLDSAQTNNLPNIQGFLTAPELKIIAAIQIFQEALHTKAYSNLVYSVIPKDKITPSEFFRNWEEDKNKTLFNRNKFFLDIFNNFAANPTKKNFFSVLIADYCLEGISFITAFRIFYDFKFSLNCMNATVENVKTIHRDENSHCYFFNKLIEEFVKEEGLLVSKEEVTNIFYQAAENEKKYITTLLTNHPDHRLSVDIPGSISCIEFITDTRLKDINLDPIYNTTDSDPWFYLNRISGLVVAAPIKENFFEGKVTQYQMSSVIDWEN